MAEEKIPAMPTELNDSETEQVAGGDFLGIGAAYQKATGAVDQAIYVGVLEGIASAAKSPAK